MALDITLYDVTLRYNAPLLASQPSNPDLFDRFIASKQPEDLSDEQRDEEKACSPKEGEGQAGYTVFSKDSDGSNFLWAFSIKGYLKEAARTIKSHSGLKNLRDRINRYVTVIPPKIRLPEVAGTIQRPLLTNSMGFPRVCLAKSDFVPEGTEVSFTLRVMDGGGVTEELLRDVLEYGENFIGMGCWRTTGYYGQFSVIKFVKVKNKKKKLLQD